MKNITLALGLLFYSSFSFSQLTTDEISGGLKEALTISCGNAAKSAAKLDGFNGNSLIRIPFPPQAAKMESSLRQMGMNAQVDEFITALNRAAEEAAKEAAQIFIQAVKEMSFEDSRSILGGKDNAATTYMAQKTTPILYERFKPIVSKALQTVQIKKYWDPLATTYNKVPFVEKVNPDLEDYTTNKAIAGLFTLMAQEEKNIRTMGASRVNDTLKKVFGN